MMDHFLINLYLHSEHNRIRTNYLSSCWIPREYLYYQININNMENIDTDLIKKYVLFLRNALIKPLLIKK